MTKDILLLTATMLGLTDVVDHLRSTEEVEPAHETLAKEDELLSYLNYVVRNITKEYFTLKTEQELVSDANCQIPYADFAKKAVSICKVIGPLGYEVTFNLYPEYIKVGRANQKYSVVYNYVPESAKSVDDKLSLPLGLDEYVIAYGVASEYALSKLLFDEANMWQDKYTKALESLVCRTKERTFRARKLK